MRCYFLFLYLGFLYLPSLCCGQDLHFSQYYNNPARLNPARTGGFEGRFRGSTLYRQQWQSVPIPWQTLSGALEWNRWNRGKNGLAFGMLLEHDKAGDAALKWTKLGGIICVHHQIGVNFSLSGGFGTEFAQRSIDVDKLKFQKQWTGDFFNGNLPNGENINASSDVFPTLSGGLNAHYERSESRTRFDIGVGSFHLNRPNAGFRQDHPAPLLVRWTILTDAILQLSDHTDMLVLGLGQRTARANEWLIGSGIRQILSKIPGKYLQIQMALQWRIGDAIIPAVQATYNEWTLGLSYDMNVSPFKIATHRRGGPEVSVIYYPIPVPNVKKTKCCPIF